MTNCLSHEQRKPGFLKTNQLLVSFSCYFLTWLSHQYFLQQKKLTCMQKKYFHLRHCVSSSNVIIGSFALNFSHQQFIRSKEGINFLRFTDGSFHKNFEFKSSRAYQETKWISITIKRNIFFWWRHQTTSINLIIGPL